MTEDNPDLATWITHDPIVFITLWQALKADGLRRLGQLLSDSGGLTPSEAREWVDYDRVQWQPVQSTISCGLFITVMFGKTVPKHLIEWTYEEGDWPLIRKTYPQYRL